LDFFVSEAALRALYAGADGVLANSEKEPFGLVGLEVMGAGGIAFVGRTGEDYAIPYGNAVVVQSDDPRELLTHLAALGSRPELLRVGNPSRPRRATARSLKWLSTIASRRSYRLPTVRPPRWTRGWWDESGRRSMIVPPGRTARCA